MQISFLYALLLCVNTIIGSGVFVNVQTLAHIAGVWSFLGYVFAFLAMLPAIFVLARFAQERPVAGGIYRYPREFLSPSLGFLSGWSYFVGKSASVGLVTHALVSFFATQQILPAGISLLVYDAIIIITLGIMNTLGVSIAGRIQWFFTSLKSMPFLLATVAGVLMVTHQYNFTLNLIQPITQVPLLSLMPLALFAFSGFEVICALGHQLEDPQKNASRVILLSSVIVLAVYSLFQVVLSFIITPQHTIVHSGLLYLGNIVLSSPRAAAIIVYAALISAISGVFANLGNNSWNIHTLAHDGFFPFGRLITKTNRYQVPWFALIIKICITLLMLAFTQEQIPLQNLSVACVTLSYMLNLMAAFNGKVTRTINQVSPIVSGLGIACCLGIILLCLKSILEHGVSTPLISIFVGGLILAAGKKGFSSIDLIN